MKKIITIAFILTVLLSLFGAIDTLAATDGYYTYTVSNGKATITDCSTSISGDFIIPSTLGGYRVTSIGGGAFSGCTGLTSITIPDSVTSIGSNAFKGCSNLTSIIIPDSVTSISSNAFSGCESLANITLPNSITSIDSFAFSGCRSLTRIKIPDSVTSIGGYAFDGCAGLANITIPDGVTSIGDSAFYGCTKLTNITIPDNVTSIGGRAFEDTEYYNNTNNWIDDVLYIGSHLIESKADLAGHYKIRKGTVCIGGFAFSGCRSLTNITIPDSVTSISNYAFWNCTSLTNITIPDSVRSIGDYAFVACRNLTSITIPDSVTSISNYVFWNCTSLTNITIPDKVSTIGHKSFEGCENLTSITIPDSVIKIKSDAFSKCANLETIYYLGTEDEFGKISIVELPSSTNDGSTGNRYFINAKKVYISTFYVKIYDMFGNVLSEKTLQKNETINLYDVVDENAQYYLYYDNKKIKKYDKTSEIRNDLVLYADVFESNLETISITGRDSALLGETVTETVYFATNKDVKYISFDVRFPEHLKHKIIPVEFMYVDETSCVTENGFTTLSLTCVYANSGYVPKNKTIIPFELEFEIDKYGKTGENSIEILDSTKYGDKTLESFTNLNSTNIEINPNLAENIVISGADTISDITEYTAIITPDYTTNKSIEWFVSDRTTATITQDGVLKPIKNGQVKIYAQTIDGSNLIAEKVVNVSAKAKLETLSTNIGDWECAFNNDAREYIVYVPENCENISVSATYNGAGVLKINSKLSITGTQSIQLNNATTTILVERIDAGDDYIDGSYTLTVVKTKPFTQGTVSEDGKSFNVRAYLVGDGSKMLLALYKEKKFVKLYNDVTVQGKIIPFTVAEDYDTVKIMVWDNFSNCQPLCDVEEINVNE